MDAKLYALAGTYLAEPHLQGKSQLVTIEKVELHEFEKGKRGSGDKGKKVKKPVLFFAGKSLPLGLTARVNIETMIDLHGRDTDKWTGKQIKLTPTTCLSFGNPNTPCIRIERA
jgi:hypothetical protein